MNIEKTQTSPTQPAIPAAKNRASTGGRIASDNNEFFNNTRGKDYFESEQSASNYKPMDLTVGGQKLPKLFRDDVESLKADQTEEEWNRIHGKFHIKPC